MKRPISLWIFGIINIALGILPSLFLIVICLCHSFLGAAVFLFTFFGWVTDREFKSFMDWFLLGIAVRGCVITLYLFSLLLGWSGLAMFKRKPYSRKLSIISISVIVLSWLGYIILSAIHQYLYRNNSFNVGSLQVPDFIFLCLLIYAFLLIKYFMRPAIKEQLDGKYIKSSLRRIIFITLSVLIILVFGHSIPLIISRFLN